MGIVEETAAIDAADESADIDFDSTVDDSTDDGDDAFGDGFDDFDDEDPDDWGSDDEDGEADAEDEGDDPDSVEDGDLHTIKVGGEEIQLSYEELIAAAQQGQDYTRKTQLLAEQRQQLAAWEHIAEAFEEDPEGVIRSLAAQFNVPIGGGANQDDDEDFDLELMDPVERELREVREELAALKSEREQDLTVRQEQEAIEAVYAEVDEVAAKHGVEFDEAATEELLQFAVDNNIGNLDVAYVAMQALRPAPQERPQTQRKRTAPPVEGGRGRSSRAVKSGAKRRFDSVEDAFEAAFQAHRG